jgi:Ulp1 family protease
LNTGLGDQDRYTNNDIIDFFSAFMTRNDGVNQTYLALPSLVFTKASVLTTTDSTDFVDSVERFFYGAMRKQALASVPNLFETKVIDIPIHFTGGLHWSRAFVCNISQAFGGPQPSDGTVCILHIDPLAGFNSTDSVASVIRKTLNSLLQRNRYFTDANLPSFQVKIPQQSNGVSCGYRSMMVLHKMYQLAMRPCGTMVVSKALVASNFAYLVDKFLSIKSQAVTTRFATQLKELVTLLGNLQHQEALLV